MAVELNHTIVNSTDADAEARFVADVLGLPEPTRFGPFTVVEVANGVSLDFMTAASPASQHYAFLISEAEFDGVAARLAGRDTWADPGHRTPGQNAHNGGRGMYFDSPSGHNLEVLTTPYA
ncbi:cysteine transferase [Pseudonocardia sulfidoxydans NBRC 16205]|uniref:Cysteine transferase n=1 Tax=Pseudonocardia sulfidoxydans NBRC 16205 TaxID=1223511 RepID=A0A511D994_9PSEU|nr:VOC family protein [Pseudonocardia sulfidoxydans]GEL21346.1 cysteine transferase [Pseudonocardia sulfidoxydans NBRC 16205]